MNKSSAYIYIPISHERISAYMPAAHPLGSKHSSTSTTASDTPDGLMPTNTLRDLPLRPPPWPPVTRTGSSACTKTPSSADAPSGGGTHCVAAKAKSTRFLCACLSPGAAGKMSCTSVLFAAA